MEQEIQVERKMVFEPIIDRIRDRYPLTAWEQGLLSSNGLRSLIPGIYSSVLKMAYNSEVEFRKKWKEWLSRLSTKAGFSKDLGVVLRKTNELQRLIKDIKESSYEVNNITERRRLDDEFEKYFELLVCLRNSPEHWFGRGMKKDFL